MRQAPPAVLAMQYLGLHATQCDRNVNIRVPFVGTPSRLDARLENTRAVRIYAHFVYSYRIFRRGGITLKYLDDLLGIAHLHDAGSVDDHLWGVGGLQSQSVNIGRLALGHCRRRGWVLPAVVVPIVYVLTEDDQLRPGKGL